MAYFLKEDAENLSILENYLVGQDARRLLRRVVANMKGRSRWLKEQAEAMRSER